MATLFFGSFLLSIAAAVTAEFFIEWAQERGWYANSSHQLARVLQVFIHTITRPQLLLTAAFAAGLVTGLWFDWFTRQAEFKRQKSEKSAERLMLLGLYSDVEAAKRMLQGNENLVSYECFHEMACICMKLAKLGIETPFHGRYTDKFTYQDFRALSYRYLACIAPYVRDGSTQNVRYWAKNTLAGMMGTNSQSLTASHE